MLKKMWISLMGLIFRLIMLMTFLGIPITLIYIYYNLYINDYNKCVIGCLIIVTIAHINKSVQGGK